MTDRLDEIEAPWFCIIKEGHVDGPVRATWTDEDHPEFRVCDRHKHQYETAYDDYSHIKWVPV
jgi:hypothetical protein